MIRLENVTWHTPAFRLEAVSFMVETGKYGVLMGKTGTGKTTLIEIICGLRRPKSGRVWLGEREVTDDEPGSRGLGYVPQDGALFPTMTVREQIGFALRMRGRSSAEISRTVLRLADEVSIPHLIDRMPQGLSGGEKQRVALARALAHQPSVLLLDEPLASVDEDTQDDLIALLKRTQREHNITVLHVTHSKREATALGEVRLRLENGSVAADTATASLR